MATEEQLVAGLVQRGMPLHVAQGFVTNFKDESGLNPGINEIAPIVPGSRGGYGLYQLTGPRRRQYEAWAAENGFDLADPNAQLDFLMLELDTTERAAWEKIKNTSTPGEAAAAIVNSFLRPAEAHRAKRERAYLGGDVSYAPQVEYASNALAGPAGSPATPQNALATMQQPKMQWVDMRQDPTMFMTTRRNALAMG
jgi:hypothetical protein